MRKGCLPSVLLLAALALAALLLACLPLRAEEPAPARAIGIEGDSQVVLGRNDYQPRPLDDRTPLILRIEQVTPAADGKFAYDFHTIGFEPGEYKLADYLMHPDGTPPAELGDLRVTVKAILPPDHDGSLTPYAARPFPWFGGYRIMLAGLAVFWALGLAAIVWFGRKRKVVVVEAPPVPVPTYAERMRPFVEAAAAGGLDVAGQAELERLFTGYWREKLGLADERMADILAKLKVHPEAGTLLRALERWLHRPGGATQDEVNELLEPYRHAPAVERKEVAA